MSNSTSRKLSMGLIIGGFVLIASVFILFLAQKAFVLEYGPGAMGSTIFTSLITLGFGGSWNATYGQTKALSGNALLAIAFIFVIIALLISIVILYGHITKKFLPKTNLILSMIVVGLMLFATVSICCTKAIGLAIFSKESGGPIIEIKKYASVTGNVIAAAVLGFVSIGCVTAFSLVPYIKQKVTK